MLRKLLAALFLFAFVVASAQESSGTSTVALSARRPAPAFSLEWRDPHTAARVTEWNIGDSEVGVVNTYDLALFVSYSNVNPHTNLLTVTLEHSTWTDGYDITYSLFSDPAGPESASGLSLYDPLPSVTMEPRGYGKGSGYWPMREGATNLSPSAAFLRLAVSATEDAWQDLDGELVATILHQ